MTSIVEDVRPRRGRPRKFLGPSSAVTLTLPKEVIATLKSIDTDLSRAVVRLTQPEVAKRPHPSAELALFGRKAVIVVNPTPTLEDRTGISLVPLPDGRALISFDRAQTIAQLELAIRDAVDDHRLSQADQQIFETVANILGTARRSDGVALHQRSIIVLEAVRPSQLHGRKDSVAADRPTRRRTRPVTKVKP
jgi:hypothetical protein